MRLTNTKRANISDALVAHLLAKNLEAPKGKRPSNTLLAKLAAPRYRRECLRLKRVAKANDFPDRVLDIKTDPASWESCYLNVRSGDDVTSFAVFEGIDCVGLIGKMEVDVNTLPVALGRAVMKRIESERIGRLRENLNRDIRTRIIDMKIDDQVVSEWPEAEAVIREAAKSSIRKPTMSLDEIFANGKAKAGMK